MNVEFKQGRAVIDAEEGGGFDPTQIPTAVEDAGFGPGEIRLEAKGMLVEHEGMLALQIPGPPLRLVLAGGEAIEELKSSGLPLGSSIRVEGLLHPSHADKAPGMEVALWEVLE